MAQHDFTIDNQSAPAFRGDLNNALEALGTLSSGATAPATTYANMLWYDTANNILKMRSEADDAWIDLGTLDQSGNTFAPAGVPELTQVQVEDDTSTVFGQVSGQRLAQAVLAQTIGFAALGAIAAGASVKVSSDSEKSINSTSFSTVLSLAVAQTGTLRVSLRQRTQAGIGSNIAEVLSNGASVQSWTTSSSTYVSRTIDVTISAPTNIVIRYRGSSSGTNQSMYLDQVRLSTNGETLWPLGGFGIESFVE